jgi:hypothetical protein
MIDTYRKVVETGEAWAEPSLWYSMATPAPPHELARPSLAPDLTSPINTKQQQVTHGFGLREPGDVPLASVWEVGRRTSRSWPKSTRGTILRRHREHCASWRSSPKTGPALSG